MIASTSASLPRSASAEATRARTIDAWRGLAAWSRPRVRSTRSSRSTTASATRRIVRLGPMAISTRRPEAARSRDDRWDLGFRHARVARERTIGPGRKAREAQRGGDPRRRLGIGQTPQPRDRRGVAAADASTHRLDHETTPQRGRRALLAEHERLAMDRHHGLGEEELAERGRLVRPARSTPARQECAPTSAVPRWRR